MNKDKDNLSDAQVDYGEMFPDNFLDVVKILTSEMGWEPDYCVLPMLVTAAGAIGNARCSHIAGYGVKSILWGCSVGAPSINKSAPFNFAVQPLHDIFQVEFKRWERDHQYWKNLEKDDQKTSSEPQLIENLISDITIEKVGVVLKSNPKGAILAMDELKGWISNFERYSKGSSMEAYLQLFQGEPITVSRMLRDTIYVPSPFLSIAGTTQPDVLSRTFADAVENGLKERLLFVYPDAKPKPWEKNASKQMKEKAAELWGSIINNLYGLKADIDGEGKVHSEFMPFNTDAKDLLFDWNEHNTEQKIEHSTYAAMLGKADIICPRLALILQLIEDPSSRSINKNNAIRAINLIEYLKTHSRKVIQMINEGTPGSPTPKKRLYDALPDEFTTDDALKTGATLGKSVASIKRYLKDTAFFQHLDHGKYSKVY